MGLQIFLYQGLAGLKRGACLVFWPRGVGAYLGEGTYSRKYSLHFR